MTFEEQIYFGCAAYSMLHPHRASELNQLFLTIGNGYEWNENGELVNLCGETNFKNGKPRSVKSAVAYVFKRRKLDAAARRKHERAYQRDLKAHPEKYPKPDNAGLDDLINKAIAAMAEAQKKDPEGYAKKRAAQLAEMKESTRRWKAAERYEYKVPTDIKKRIAYQTPEAGAYEGYNNWYPACEKYSRIFTYNPATIKNDWLEGIIEVCQLVIANPPKPTPSYPHDPDGKHAERQCAETVALVTKALDRALAIKSDRLHTLSIEHL